jgi:hypothetical protein
VRVADKSHAYAKAKKRLDDKPHRH